MLIFAEKMSRCLKTRKNSADWHDESKHRLINYSGEGHNTTVNMALL